MEKISEEVLEQKAQAIRKYLKTDLRYDLNFLPRPFMVELTGTPSSGKSTVTKELYDFFRQMGLRIYPPLEGAEEIQHIPRNTPVYNIRTGIYAWIKMIDESFHHNLDLIIFNRCIFDSYCWMMYWKGKELLSAEEEDMFQSFFLSRLWTDKIDLCYFMICEPDKAMQRENRIALSDKVRPYTNPATIKTLVERYKKAYEVLSPQHPQISLIDTTNLDEQTMVQTIALDILNTLEDKTKENKI